MVSAARPGSRRRFIVCRPSATHRHGSMRSYRPMRLVTRRRLTVVVVRHSHRQCLDRLPSAGRVDCFHLAVESDPLVILACSSMHGPPDFADSLSGRVFRAAGHFSLNGIAGVASIVLGHCFPVTRAFEYHLLNSYMYRCVIIGHKRIVKWQVLGRRFSSHRAKGFNGFSCVPSFGNRS